MGASSDGPTARQSDDSGEDSPSELQVYTVKLLLRLAGHVAQQRSMGQRQDNGAVPAGDLVTWIQACCALLVDAAAPALGGAINAALPLFLEAFSEAEWAEHGPNEYGMHTLELLLATCDLLLWPDLIRGDLPGQALARWLNFLIGIQRSIRAMVPEDQAVKVLATHLELEYRAHSGAIG
ncbi:hypothetical protein APUTEX25_000714 [Auxenochlorella protothecoides]|uniref:Uncharacterized protein n=1 Tax=Auxenochlorella protothecoides TaxID=3075 RepID=A0A3M7KSB2_AUXPR|nr:hypothetical protein APUTEX25_000714 [Auxenochlorella protothecoides]|eukprot:RMZ52595.1 hypothetical protein APUTEX25_000714 [Auxenochlorella protothecoides]